MKGNIPNADKTTEELKLRIRKRRKNREFKSQMLKTEGLKDSIIFSRRQSKMSLKKVPTLENKDMSEMRINITDEKGRVKSQHDQESEAEVSLSTIEFLTL